MEVEKTGAYLTPEETERLAAYRRKAKGWTQSQLAEKLEMFTNQGKRKNEKTVFYLLSYLAKRCHYARRYVGVTKTGSGSPFAKMSTF